DTICQKAMSKRPEDRYASAGELAADLGRHLRGERVGARPSWWVVRLWRRRRRTLVALAGALALAAAAGLAGALWAPWPERQEVGRWAELLRDQPLSKPLMHAAAEAYLRAGWYHLHERHFDTVLATQARCRELLGRPEGDGRAQEVLALSLRTEGLARSRAAE